MLEAEKASFAGYSPGGMPDNIACYKPPAPDTVVAPAQARVCSIWFTYNELAQLNPFPMAWDISKTGAKAGSGGCTTDTAADGWAKCKAVYNFLTAQAKNTSSYAQPGRSGRSWTGRGGCASYNINGNYTLLPNPKYSGRPSRHLGAEVPGLHQ